MLDAIKCRGDWVYLVQALIPNSKIGLDALVCLASLASLLPMCIASVYRLLDLAESIDIHPPPLPTQPKKSFLEYLVMLVVGFLAVLHCSGIDKPVCNNCP
jgi:hypothetical protein